MSIIGQTRKFVTTQILSHIPRKHHSLFSFGLQALSLTPYDSLSSNARQIIANTSTASSKIYRLVSNKKMVKHFSRLIALCGLVTKKSVINVDFSTFCGFQALCFGVQTGNGRAIPIWNNCITYPIKFVGSQNIFVLEEITKFGKCLGFYPSFVFDRGFWIPLVMKFMLQNKICFYLRIKQGQELSWIKDNYIDRRKAKKIGKYTKDATITLFGHKMRLIVSPPPPKQTNPKKEQNTQRWYIITTNKTSTRGEIIQIYATRFEIEEVFKDYKHIQKLKSLRIKTKETFTILLWFATLAFWIAWWIKGARGDTQVHPKKKRSFFRDFWEELQRCLRYKGMRRLVCSPG